MLLRTLVRSMLLGLIALLTPAALFAEKPGAATSPADAGPEFAPQGEYLGEVVLEEGQRAQKFGAQIIAQGGGKFKGAAYIGGLPGAGADMGRSYTGEGKLLDGVVKFEVEPVSATLKDGQIVVADAGGNKLGTLKKVERKSPTLGAKPPAGAVVLFDGRSAEQFKGKGMTDDGLLKEGQTSKQLFQSFSMHLEFQLPFMPSAAGQARGNSGFYAQGRYEVQVLDSFGLDPKRDDCGAIYEIAKPTVNMCLPPLAWQTYDIDFTAAEYQDGKKVKDARMTVKHNGVLIHDNVEVPRATRAAPVKEGPEPGPIYLQDHGNPVRFRNIWLVEKK